eukprot:COSAG04_NODE_1002_length_8834_cov_10.753520_6_plen_58_part_00
MYALHEETTVSLASLLSSTWQETAGAISVQETLNRQGPRAVRDASWPELSSEPGQAR